MKKFLFFIMWFIPIPLFIISLNYFIDPANLFKTDYEKNIADYLVKGSNVTNVVNYNERLLQKYFIQNMNNCPEVIALGSSRIMQVRGDFLKTERFINSGVSFATLEDLLAIYHLYEKKGCRIKKVILGPEPYMFNDRHSQNRWLNLEDNYNEIFNTLQNRTNNSHSNKKSNYSFKYQYKELLSASYFKTSFVYLFKGVDNQILPTKMKINGGFTRLNDGSIYYDKLSVSSSSAQVKNKAQKFIAGLPNYEPLQHFSNVSEQYKNLFSTFIMYLQKQNIDVEFFLAPYHPIVYEYFKENKYFHKVLDCEKYFRSFASANNIKVWGSYDPAKFVFKSNYFLDGVHCKEEAIIILFGNGN